MNADDFGFTRDVNSGIIHAHNEGILTSATLMATGDAFEDAVRLARDTPSLDVGCHLVLVQGRSLITGEALPSSVADAILAVSTGRIDAYAELRVQIQRILSAGVNPTHLDTHKHTHIWPAVFRVVVRLAREFRIPYVRLPFDATVPLMRIPCELARECYSRMARNSDVKMTDHFLGFRLTGSLTEQAFAVALSSLREGTTEFMCHPGFLGPELRGAETRLKESRVRELEVLTSRRIREWIEAEEIELSPFA